ncbi:DcaP family trimeric outer membrane transporter [Microbulbifer thermotolerans]|nr:DcaP family trimeric outer membrane transporter [Microbulbifer thermotolerans]MCX2779176.1 DcaP family trimeric outer membrane transporter [Microbulbifer thermotolerans]MCX2781721.1 DcaP family trimeric outer membrane transporter [Microbulbifer thermotolerans]MCX2793593.1 DcaP family trimeric outer membrane transporter [Microbulbifer thermotolerans]MCX2803600.1 DcaP family trimeric outer membrane transporter [Microbulbifer thermotolerans]MCX2835418.1 DcaP family trimeric outer membrane tran
MSTIKIKSVRTAGLFSTMMISLLPAVASAQTNVEELQTRIEELQAQIDKLAAEAEQRRNQVVENPEPPQQQSGTQIEIGGFMKLDTMFSDYSDGSSATAGIGEDFLVPSTIPVGGEGGDGKFDAHAKSSRLFIKTHTPVAGGQINTHLEIDAMASSQGDERISNSYAQRLRHAYVDWQIDASRSLLAGQTWSTFFNVGALPEGLDFVGPVGTIFERQPQLRYTQKIGSGSIQLAAENPSTTLYNGSENPYDDGGTPDIVLRYNNSAGDFSYSVASMSRELAYDNGTDTESVRGHAISVSGKYQFGRDDIRFMLSSGNALGRYMGLNSYRAGIIEADGDIELIDQTGGFIALRHFWNDQWRSNLVLSASKADNPGSVSDTTPSAYRSLHANLLYSPVPKLTLGGEYIFASKEVENSGGSLVDDEGDLQRLQFSVKYVF